MPTVPPNPDLWSLVPGRSQIDPDDLLIAIENACRDETDHRTRLLVRDSISALQQHWGKERLADRLSSQAKKSLQSMIDGLVGEGFPSLAGRIMKAVEVETVLQFLRDLGSHVREQSSLNVGGSIALMLSNHLRRSTDYIDVIDGLPAWLRDEHDLLKQLAQRYGLRLAHFQSRYLPSGWEKRL